MLKELVPYLVAFLVSGALIIALMPIGVRVGLTDQPGGRKDHEGAVPLVGGLAIFAGFAAALFVLHGDLAPYRALLVSGALLVVVGLLDDLHEISWQVRLFAQVGAAILMVQWGGVYVADLGLASDSVASGLGWLAQPFTVIATVGLINAMNMSDGMDGLAGGLALVALAALAVVAGLEGRSAETLALGVLAAAVWAFLLFNFRFPWVKSAKVFMGDAGSTFLGFVLAWYAISLSQGQDAVLSPAVVPWLLAIPVLDTLAVTLRRLLKGQSPFRADRQHLHHVLLGAGMSVPQVVMSIVGFAALVAAAALTAGYAGASGKVLVGGFVFTFFLYFWATRRAWHVMKYLRAHRRAHA